MKRLTSFLVALYLATTALWAYSFKSGEIYYNITNSLYQEVEVTNDGTSSYYGSYWGNIEIPSIVYFMGQPFTVTRIGDHAFSNSKGLTSITIPESIWSIGEASFEGCTQLSSIVVDENNTSYDSRNNCNAIIETATNVLVVGCQTTTIPYGIVRIGDYAFYYCEELSSIFIPNSVTSIGFKAFMGCFDLSSVVIPNRLTDIGYAAFNGCNELKVIYIKSPTPPQMSIPVDVIDGYYYLGVFSSSNGFEHIYIPCGTTEAYTSSNWGCFAQYFEEMCSTSGYEISVISADTLKGKVNFIFDNSIGELNLSATANTYYQFSHWSDGKTDNPRVLTVTQDTTLIAYFVPATSGKCGDDLYWSYWNDTLSITGTGDMYDYAADSANAAPWVLFRDSISMVVFPEGITYIGTHAFRQLPLLTEVIIPNAVEEIGESAFAECAGLGKVVIGSGNNSRLTTMGDSVFINSRKLHEIHIAATEPPVADRTTFLNYNVHLYVPCESKDKYDLDMVFGDFKYIECLDTDTPVEDFAVTPAQTSAQFVWGAPSNAATYTLNLQQEDAPFFTLVFNATGQLQSISLAPIGSQVRLTAAEKAGNGFTFNATGLTARTLYNYDLTIRDAAEVALQNYSGYFYTTSDIPTGTEDSAADDTTPRKVFRDGQVYILRGGKTYTVMGQEISDLSNLSRGEAQ